MQVQYHSYSIKSRSFGFSTIILPNSFKKTYPSKVPAEKRFISVWKSTAVTDIWLS